MRTALLILALLQGNAAPTGSIQQLERALLQSQQSQIQLEFIPIAEMEEWAP